MKGQKFKFVIKRCLYIRIEELKIKKFVRFKIDVN